MSRLRLRYENRPSPYFMVMREHFGDAGKFTDPAHTCCCNHCGKDLASLIQSAVEEKVAQIQPATVSCEKQLTQVDSEELNRLQSEITELQE